MDAQWARLGAALAASRGAQNLTQEDVVARTGVSLSTVQAIERGGPFKGVTASMRLYAVVVGWAPGSIETVLDGGTPSDVPAVGGQTGITGLPYRITQALADGTALDTRIKALGSGGEIILVVKGHASATREEMRAALREWERQEGYLDQLGEVAADDQSDKDK